MIQNNFYNRRLFHIWVLLLVAAGIIVLRLVNIQIIHNKDYLRISERNRTQIIYQNAPRGRVLTSDGASVADNKPAYTLMYLPVNKNPDFLESLSDHLSQKLETSTEELFEILSKASTRGRSVRLADNLSVDDMFFFSELQAFYPGIELVVENRRYYPQGPFLTHLLGYIGKLTPEQWKQKTKGWRYRLNSYIGKTGIEAGYEDLLRGTDGGIYMEIDYRGRVKNRLQQQDWQPGNNIILTIDSLAQQVAEEALSKSLTGEGAVVAINPKNGAILAMASSPTFNPNIFVDSGLKVDQAIPEFDLSVKGQYAPASMFKIIVGAALLEEAGVEPEEKIMCKGFYETEERQFKCWQKTGHGEQNFYQAMANSCDVYYYHMGLRLGPTNIEKYQHLFRLGIPSGIDIANEKAGNIFGPTARAKQRGYWFIGDTLNLSIGQGELLITPIQAVQVIASIANNGDFWKPYYIDKVVDADDNTIEETKPELLSSLDLTQKTLKILKQSLKATIDNGTGRLAKSKVLEIYGKTGTAQNAHGDEHAWFAAYGNKPGEEPEIAVAALVVHGKSGSAIGGIAKNVIEAYYRVGNYDPKIKHETKAVAGDTGAFISTHTITNITELLE